MTAFTVHTRDTAPAGAHEVIDSYIERFGVLFNLVGIMAESPATLRGYATNYSLLGDTAFSPAEQQLMFLAISRANGCHYCVAAHSMGGKMAGLDDEIIASVRDGRTILDPKLAAIADFATKVVDKRGHVSAQDVENFLTAGHTQAQILEVVLAVATKTISNYINHIASTPLDAALTDLAWVPASSEAAQ